jgi:hypothetical protein
MGEFPAGHLGARRPEVRLWEGRGNAINYPGNPKFRSSCAFKMAPTSEEMENKRTMLSSHAVVITDDGPMAVHSRGEVKDIILNHFCIRKHEYYLYHSHPEPFTAIFLEVRDRDTVFTACRVVEGPIELGFHEWDIDHFGNREHIPYHVKLNLEGIPQHAWSREVADKVLCDKVIVHHVLEDIVRCTDQRVYECWTFCKYPSRLPQVVFLSLAQFDP